MVLLQGSASGSDLIPVPLVPVTPLSQYADYGYGLAFGEGMVAVGAPFDGVSHEGSVYLFEQSPSDPAVWNNTGKISLPDPEPEAAFGMTLELADDFLFVSAPYMDRPVQNAGVVYVYERTPEVAAGWTLRQRIDAPEPTAGGDFGLGLAAVGDSLFVGAPNEDPSRTGEVHVFQRSPGIDGTWTLQSTLRPPRLQGDVFFGADVDVDGDTLAVGGRGARSVFVFEKGSGTSGPWELSQTLQYDSEFNFGISLDLDENRLAVGSGKGSSRPVGSTYVFVRTADTPWTETARLTAPRPSALDLFGYDVAFSESDLYVGAVHLQHPDPGVVYAFRSEGGDDSQWTLIDEIVAPDPRKSDAFGGQIEVWNGMLAVGSFEADEMGKAYVYVPEPHSWHTCLIALLIFVLTRSREETAANEPLS